MALNLTVPKRTHQIIVQSIKGGKRSSKSFSIYTKKHSNDFLFKEIDKVMKSDKLNREMHFKVKNCSHIVILTHIESMKHFSKCYPLHQYSVQELNEMLRKHFIGVNKK